MSPGATMERVYRDLKARIMDGAFAPGERLDPARLAENLAASTTPVRDALHRMSGERLIDSWHQEGFRSPVLAEPDLRDLYSWSLQVLLLALRDPAPPQALRLEQFGDEGGDYPARLAALFRGIALLSANRELRHAILNLADRSQVLRRAELVGDPSAEPALRSMENNYRLKRWAGLRADLTAFHRRRLARVADVAAALRARAPPLG